MTGHLTMLAITTATAILSAGAIVDEQTLVPLGLLVTAVLGTAAVTWRVAMYVARLRRELDDAKAQLLDLERMYGRRRRGEEP